MPRKGTKIEGRTQKERKRLRQQMGSLKSLTVQPATKARYQLALDKFLLFLKHNGMQLPRQRAQLDHYTSEYLEHLWSQGEGRAPASDTIAGLQDQDPRLRGMLPCTWRLLKVWHTHEIPNRAAPLPETVLKAMVGHALFHGITKGGKRQGAAESVTANVQDLIRRLLQWKQSSIVPLATSASAWRSEFSATLKAFNLEQFEFRRYSLRRGGATFWFSKHGSLDRLLLQGRWHAPRTARIYINEGLAILAELKVPVASTRVFSHVYSRSLDHPLPQLEHIRQTSRTGGRGKGSNKGRKCVLLG